MGGINHSLEKATAVGSAYGVPAYVDFERMLEEVSFDVVAVATPDHLHFQPVMIALTHNKHVLVEKPLATALWRHVRWWRRLPAVILSFR